MIGRRLERRIAALRERMHVIDADGGDTYGIEDEIERLQTKLLRIRRWGILGSTSAAAITLGLLSWGIHSVFHNVSPVSVFAMPSTCEKGEVVMLDGRGSFDRDGAIRSYTWRIGDNTILEGETVLYLFESEGTHTVHLTVLDTRGASDTSSRSITVKPPNVLPVANLVYSTSTPDLAAIVQFDASSSRDSDGELVSYRWNFGDGSPPQFGVRTSHRFSKFGRFLVQLHVEDDRGGKAKASAEINVISGVDNREGEELPPEDGRNEIRDFLLSLASIILAYLLLYLQNLLQL
jgi:hypothetical protein